MSEFVTETGCTIQVKIDVWDDDRTVLSLDIKNDPDGYIEVILNKSERAQLITNLAFKS